MFTRRRMTIRSAAAKGVVICRGLRVLADWIEQRIENLNNTLCGRIVTDRRERRRQRLRPGAVGAYGIPAVAQVSADQTAAALTLQPVLPGNVHADTVQAVNAAEPASISARPSDASPRPDEPTH